MAHPEIGRRILERLIADLGEQVLVESMPRQEGNQMHTILAPRLDKSGRTPGAPKPQAAPATAGEGT